MKKEKSSAKFGMKLDAKLLFICAAILSVLAPSHAWAWAHHHAITRTALSTLPELTGKAVRYTEFNDMLRDLGIPDVDAFNQQLQIHRSFRFEPKLGEIAGQLVSLVDVLAEYSDEPDWLMDQGLFEKDQYPELWDDAYSMMGGKTGTASQSFRHMYWQHWDPIHLLKTFKMPLSHAFKAMGTAPERAQAFILISRAARAKGHDYWAARFMADALHYLEDCSQPFHTSQVPTKFYLTMIFDKNGDGFKSFVPQLTNVISYYHFAFEDYVSELLVAATEGRGNEAGAQLIVNLTDPDAHPSALSYKEKDIAKEVRAMARKAVLKSAVAGRAAWNFFPDITVDYATLDPNAFMNDDWWKTVRKNGEECSSARDSYFGVIRSMFEPLGYAVRQVVSAELGLKK